MSYHIDFKDKIINLPINGNNPKRNLRSISRCWYGGGEYHCKFLYTDGFHVWHSLWDQSFESQFPVFPYDATEYNKQLEIAAKHTVEDVGLESLAAACKKMSKRISKMEKEFTIVGEKLDNISRQNIELSGKIDAVRGIVGRN